MRFEFLTATLMLITVFWVVNSRSLICGYQHFRRTYHLELEVNVIHCWAYTHLPCIIIVTQFTLKMEAVGSTDIYVFHYIFNAYALYVEF
jgi:hypothetical protein